MMGELEPTRANDVLDRNKVESAIDGVLDLFERDSLTVAEAIHVTTCIGAVLKASYPGVYELLTVMKGLDLEAGGQLEHEGPSA